MLAKVAILLAGPAGSKPWFTYAPVASIFRNIAFYAAHSLCHPLRIPALRGAGCSTPNDDTASHDMAAAFRTGSPGRLAGPATPVPPPPSLQPLTRLLDRLFPDGEGMSCAGAARPFQEFNQEGTTT